MTANADVQKSAFWITDVAFSQVVYVSHGYEHLWGRSRASLYAEPRSLFDAIHPADKERVVEQYSRQKEGVALDLEYRIIRPDGSVRWVWDRRSPMGERAELVYAGTAQDITDRKNALTELQRHSSVVRSSGEAILSTTLEGVITAWNPAAEALFGFSARDAIGSSIMTIVPPDGAAEEVRLLQRIADGEQIGTIETRLHRRNGLSVDIALTISPLLADGGKIIGAAMICHDISREKSVRNALLESERSFRETFDAAAVGIAHASLDGQLVRVNDRLCAMTGFSRPLLLQQRVAGITDADDRTIDAVQFGDLITGKCDSYTVEKRLVRRNDFPLWTEFTLRAARPIDGVPSYLVITIQDISDRRDLTAQLRQAQKLATIGQLASGVAHDFNNVLGYVAMRAELTSTYPELPKNILADLQQIKAVANRATHLTRQLLSFSRHDSGSRPQKLDVNELVSATTKMVQRLLEEHIQLDLRLHPAPLVVHLDPGIVDQVLLNLAVNARDAMPEGGTLTIETSEFVVADRESRPSPEIAPGTYACLRVTDTGAGIAPEHLPRIFEPFFTTKEQGHGTGLGLTMVSSLVRQQHGWITVDSELGRGSTFRVFLPVPNATEPALIDEAAPTPARPGSETILLVEDEADLRITARMVLQLKGYTVLEAATGNEALALWSRHKDEIAVVFTDMVLPDGINGRSLVARARADKPTVGTIITTGYSADFATGDLAARDGDNFLPKPYSVERLLNVIQRNIARA